MDRVVTAGLIAAAVLFCESPARADVNPHGDCWIDANTGEPVGVYPQGADPHEFTNGAPQDHYGNHITGGNFALQSDGSWVDTATGQPVSTFPIGADPREFTNGAPQDHYGNHITGRTFVRVPCPPRDAADVTPSSLSKPKPTAPSPLEEKVRNEINRARQDPSDFRLEPSGFSAPLVDETRKFLATTKPAPLLEQDDRLRTAAKWQLAEKGPQGLADHTGADGSTPAQRIQKAGLLSSLTAEEISVGETTPAAIVAQLVIDPPGPWHPHRQDIFSKDLVAVGIACGPNAKWGAMCVIDLSGPPLTPSNSDAATSATSPAAKRECPTWIDAATGQAAKTVPIGVDREELARLQRGDDPNHAHGASGRNYVREPDGSWIDAVTGEAAMTVPIGVDREELARLQRGDDPSHAHGASGRNYVLVPCRPAGPE